MWGPFLERHVANVQATLLYFLGICIWKWPCQWNLPCERTQPLRRLRTVGKVKLPPNCQHRLKYILTPFPQFPSGVLQWFTAGWAHNSQRIMGWAEMNDASSHGPGQVLRGSIGFSPWKLSTRHRLVVKSEWHHPRWSAQHSRYNTVILNINSSALGTPKYSDEKSCPSFEGPTLERERWQKWLIMDGRDGEDVHTGRGEGSGRPSSRREGDLRLNKAEMGRKKVQAGSDCEVMPNSLWPHGLLPTRLLHPWDFPGKNTGVGCHFLLQEIFPTQGLNLGLWQCKQTLLPFEPPGKLVDGWNYGGKRHREDKLEGAN